MDVCIKRSGQVCIIYLDETGQPIPIAAYSAEPLGFPLAKASVHDMQVEIAERFPGAKLKYFDAPKVERPKQVDDPKKRNMARRKAAAVVKSLGLETKAPTPTVALPPKPPQAVVALPTPELPESELLKKALIHYRMVLERRAFAAEEHQAKLSLQLKATADVIEELWGEDVVPKLERLEKRYG